MNFNVSQQITLANLLERTSIKQIQDDDVEIHYHIIGGNFAILPLIVRIFIILETDQFYDEFMIFLEKENFVYNYNNLELDLVVDRELEYIKEIERKFIYYAPSDFEDDGEILVYYPRYKLKKFL